jgi:Fic family protein
MRSAIAAFGLVFIHPLADGNGRVHRFLINDILRRDGVVKDPMKAIEIAFRDGPKGKNVNKCAGANPL